MVVLRARFGDHFDAGADAVAVALDALKRDVEPVVVAGAAIHPEFGVVVHGGDDDVDPAVAVEVAESTATMACGCGVDESGILGKGLPFSACAEVAKDGVGLLGFSSGRMRRRDVTSRDKEILPAIVVEVVERRAEACHAQALRTQTAAGRDFDEVALCRCFPGEERSAC